MKILLHKQRVQDGMMRDAFSEKLTEQMEQDEKVCYLDADLMSCVATKGLVKKYPTRALNCGIAEANMIGAAAGMSAAGMKPYAHTFGIFASRRVMDQAFMSVAYAKLNVRIIGSDPGVTAAFNGGTHMPFEDMAVMMAIPESVVLEPCDCTQVSALMDKIKDMHGLIYMRLVRKNPIAIYETGSDFEIGKGAVLKSGTDATIFCSGITVELALSAAEKLEAEGISVRVVNLFTWKPIDKELITQCAKETGAIVTTENHNATCGLGSAVANVVSETCPVPVVRHGVNDEFGEVGAESYLRERFGMTAQRIIDSTKKAIELKMQNDKGRL